MRSRTFDLNELRTLVSVADLGTLTRAADALAFTQSGVSMQLRRLEQQVGKPLLEKVGRGVRLTNDGERLVGYGRALLNLNDEAWADLQQNRFSGTLRLGIPEDYASLLPGALSYFNRLYPNVSLEVECATSEWLVEQIRERSLDLALVTRQRNSPGGEVIRREPLVWAVGRQYQPPLTDPLPLAVYAPGGDVFREVMEQSLAAAGRTWRAAYASKSMTGLRPVVDAGLAIAVVTRHMLTADLRVLDESSGLPPLPTIEIALHRPKGRPTEAAQALADLLRDQLSAPVGRRAGTD